MGLPRTGHLGRLYLALESRRMTENRDYLPVNPVSQVCPKCGAKPGKACDMLTDRMALIHIERLKAPSRSKVK
jgi:hypothetical protein